MKRVFIGGHAFAAGLTWRSLDTARQFEQAAKDLKLSAGVKIRTASNKVQAGFASRDLAEIPSLAAFVVNSGSDYKSAIMVITVQVDGETGYWLFASQYGAILPGSDQVVGSREEAAFWVKSILQLSLLPAFAPPEVRDLIPDYIVKDLNIVDFISTPKNSRLLRNKNLFVQVVGGNSGSGRTLMLLAVFSALSLGGYLVYKKNQSTEADFVASNLSMAERQAVVDRLSTEERLAVMRDLGLPGVGSFSKWLAIVQELPMASGEWSVQEIGLTPVAQAQLTWGTANGVGILSHVFAVAPNIVFDANRSTGVQTVTLDQAVSTKAKSNDLEALLIRETAELRLINAANSYRGNWVLNGATPLTSPASVPPGIPFSPKYSRIQFTITGSGYADLMQLMTHLNGIPGLRPTNLLVKIDRLSIGNWTLGVNIYVR